MEFSAIIFDCDGVLVDSVGYAPAGHFPGLPDKSVPLVQSMLDILVLGEL